MAGCKEEERDSRQVTVPGAGTLAHLLTFQPESELRRSSPGAELAGCPCAVWNSPTLLIYHGENEIKI